MEVVFKEIVEFIRKLYKKPEGFIPLHAPIFNGNEKKYVNECIDTTFVSSVGKFVDRFEEMVAVYTGSKKAVACVNGTNALHLSLLLLGVERNDEVITQPLTFIATCNAISYIGAHPVFIDIDLDTLGMSPLSLRSWLENNVDYKSGNIPYNKTTNRRIKACVPMHTFGHPCRIDEIADICAEYNIELIEDAAESLGSYYKGKHTGTFAKIGVLSFNGNKIVTTGGGGMLLFQDEEKAKFAKHITTQAKVPHQWEFVHDQVGYNYRMPNINAALGCAQMEQLSQFLLSKHQIAQSYSDFLKTLSSDITFFNESKNAQSNYWLNVILFKDKEERNDFLKFTNENGVMTRPAWELMNNLLMFNHCQTFNIENALWMEERIVNIPSSVV